ncbi:SGNH/GDSL hydrolase family protein [Amycolatopsis sp. CA-230715]|uniref:SGNH/GDSL hydrolase family protein n=1 Tax=Amycolatopsis sp. CA-230715 TaxID=2745196 RepID=UPI001C02AABD|nr:SGNH/GDSL hydrolase family protein [Amycolatopsis sp. CA-230715]QWF77418.1 Lipase 2 [Amycolatopsis sp. CA-230715]
MRRRTGLPIAAVAAVAALFTGTASAASAAEPVRYVALGDSYTSGPFIPLMRLDPLGCARSTNNYPSLLSRKLDTASFTDVSCGGAATANMTTSQSVPLGSNPPQFNALRANTDLVTVGIGGNDFNLFGTLISACPKLRAGDPTGNPCQRKFTVDGVDTMKVTAAKIRPRIAEVLAGIHARSPRAKVLAVGYPRIAPATGYCPDILPFADGDYAWLNSIEEALNQAVSDAVADDGSSSYVDTYTPSLGHDACAPDGAAWINGKDLNIFAAAQYHPFRAGMEGVASVLYRALAAARR